MPWMVKYVAMVLALAGCGHGDTCSKVYDKVAPAFANNGNGTKMDRTKEIERCKQQLASHPEREKELDCILAISGTPTTGDLVACSEKTQATKGGFEAKLQLDKIGKHAKRVFGETGKFPVGSAPLTPATDCCAGSGGRCQPDPQAWTAGPWPALEFSMDDPHRYRYSYESTDGTTFTATAVGDLDCNGKSQTVTLKGSIGSDHDPKIELQER